MGLFIIAIDILTKYWTQTHLPNIYESLPIFPYGGIGFFQNFLGGIDFSWVLATNKGAAWGLGAEYQMALMVFRILLVIAILFYALFYSNPKNDFGLTLVIAGALGNIIDFFVYGHVIDMFKFTFWGYHYPVFNVADSAIFIGILWLLFTSRKK